MGRACRICDRKFFLQAAFLRYSAQINHYQKEAEILEQKYDVMQDQVECLYQERTQVESQISEEIDRFSKADVTLKLQQENVLME